jgi:hypothetical protein
MTFHSDDPLILVPGQIAGPDVSRRRFLRQTAAAGAVLSFAPHAGAAAVDGMAGEVYVNGRRAGRNIVIKPGDQIRTGADSSLTFVLGRDAYKIRELTLLMLETKPDLAIVTGIRVVTGALLAAFGDGMKMISTRLATAGIRGTGVYVETNPVLTYFCTCYGTVDLASSSDKSAKTVQTRDHAAHYLYAKASAGSALAEAPMINHTNAELALLERLAGRMPVLPVR